MTARIRVEKEGEESLLTIPEFEALTGAAFIPQLDFIDFQVFQDIGERVRKAHKKGEISKEQLWLGSYYQNELQNSPIPEATIRWIDESVGWGVYAAKTFKKREFVAEYCGKVRKRMREDKKNGYCFEYVAAPHIPTPYTIDAQDQGGFGRWINHSERPNLRSLLVTLDGINHIILVAGELIRKGEQFLYDYGPDYWSSRSKPKNLSLTH